MNRNSRHCVKGEIISMFLYDVNSVFRRPVFSRLSITGKGLIQWRHASGLSLGHDWFCLFKSWIRQHLHTGMTNKNEHANHSIETYTRASMSLTRFKPSVSKANIKIYYWLGELLNYLKLLYYGREQQQTVLVY